jgi:hypothetical protein
LAARRIDCMVTAMVVTGTVDTVAAVDAAHRLS